MSHSLSPTPRTCDARHVLLLREALQEANKCVPSPGAFCVGCVLAPSASSESWSTFPTSPWATGYSRELEGNTHAEANAIDKYIGQLGLIPSEATEFLSRLSLYTTLEPCSVRTSGLTPCVERILNSGIQKVYMGVEEPTDFVVCEGVRILREAGVEVWVVVDPATGADLAAECLAAARRSA